jgi:hypothetical protein
VHVGALGTTVAQIEHGVDFARAPVARGVAWSDGYDREKREARDGWAKRLEEIVKGESGRARVIGFRV